MLNLVLKYFFKSSNRVDISELDLIHDFMWSKNKLNYYCHFWTMRICIYLSSTSCHFYNYSYILLFLSYIYLNNVLHDVSLS